MSIFETLASNPILARTFMAWFISQSLKVIISWIQAGRISWERFIGAGGMPSVHSAIVTCLSAAVIRHIGYESPLAAVTIVFAAIVMYDAAGVRQAAGKQAEVINKIIEQFRLHKQVTEIPLKELLGHTPTEVLAGGLLGIVIAYWP